MGDPLYRVRQFWHAVKATPLTPEEEERVRAVLSDEGLALYQSMPPGDQRHALTIYDALRAQGYDARPLLQAALLHDVAKRGVALEYRTGVILLGRYSPDALRRVASADTRSWRYPFYLSLHHPELGAKLAAESGIDPDAVILIRAHQCNEPTFAGKNAAALGEWQRALKRLDDVN